MSNKLNIANNEHITTVKRKREKAKELNKDSQDEACDSPEINLDITSALSRYPPRDNRFIKPLLESLLPIVKGKSSDSTLYYRASTNTIHLLEDIVNTHPGKPASAPNEVKDPIIDNILDDRTNNQSKYVFNMDDPIKSDAQETKGG